MTEKERISFETALNKAVPLVINRDSHGSFWIDADSLVALAPTLEADSQQTVHVLNKVQVVALQTQLQEKRNNALEWVKHNLIDRKDFVDDDAFEGYAVELCNTIQVFMNRQVLGCVEAKP